MDITETREKIMNSDEFVLSEVEKLRVLYALKKEIRYGHKRTDENHTESVAEHIYAIHCLIDYFLPLEDPNKKWSKLKIHEIAQYHDLDEIETGDIVANKKTSHDYKNEKEATEKVVGRIPESLQKKLLSLRVEFYEQQSIESKFVKAIDKLESLIHIFDEQGRETIQTNKFTEQNRNEYVKDSMDSFQIMGRFETVLNKTLNERKFYYLEP